MAIFDSKIRISNNLKKRNMKRNLIILIATVFITLTVKGQNLFFIDEQSFPCTETITLQSNSDEWYLDNLKVLFAKDGKKALFCSECKNRR